MSWDGWKLRLMAGTWVRLFTYLLNGHARNLQVYLARNGPASVMHQAKTEDAFLSEPKPVRLASARPGVENSQVLSPEEMGAQDGHVALAVRPHWHFGLGATNPTLVQTGDYEMWRLAPRDRPLRARRYNYSLGLERM